MRLYKLVQYRYKYKYMHGCGCQVLTLILSIVYLCRAKQVKQVLALMCDKTTNNVAEVFPDPIVN
jgi:hypothetical protein